MDPTVGEASLLAHESHGAGTPVVLLHGLTFDRRSWRPVVEELDGALRTIAVDLPAHGDSDGPPATADEVAVRVHDLVRCLGVERPVLVGHSYGAAVASVYAATYPTRGLVMVDSGPAIRSFAGLVQQLAPMLRGPGFADAWQAIERSLGLDRIPEPDQSLVRAGHVVDQDVVLGYWHPVLTTPPDEFQAWVDSMLARIDVPVLAVFGQAAPAGDRQRLERLRDARVEEHPGEGHFVHLVDPARFACSLRGFVGHVQAR